jgi:hypothetical protein
MAVRIVIIPWAAPGALTQGDEPVSRLSGVCLDHEQRSERRSWQGGACEPCVLTLVGCRAPLRGEEASEVAAEAATPFVSTCCQAIVERRSFGLESSRIDSLGRSGTRGCGSDNEYDSKTDKGSKNRLHGRYLPARVIDGRLLVVNHFCPTGQPRSALMGALPL